MQRQFHHLDRLLHHPSLLDYLSRRHLAKGGSSVPAWARVQAPFSMSGPSTRLFAREGAVLALGSLDAAIVMFVGRFLRQAGRPRRGG